MSKEQLIKSLERDIDDMRLYHEIGLQKCDQLKEKLAAVSTPASKKKTSYEEFLESDVCKTALLKRDLLIQRKLKN